MKRSLSPVKASAITSLKPDFGDKENREYNYSERRSLSAVEQDKAHVMIEELQGKIEDLQGIVSQKDADAANFLSVAYKKDTRLRELEAILVQKDAKIQELDCLMVDKDSRLLQLECSTGDKEQTLQDFKDKIQQQDAALKEVQNEKNQLERRTKRLENAKPPEEEDFRKLKQRVEDQKILIENLQKQLRRTTCAASLVTPGEYARLATEAKKNERLSSVDNELRTEVKLLHKEIALLRRRLPAEVVDAVACQVTAHFEDEAEACVEQGIESWSTVGAHEVGVR